MAIANMSVLSVFASNDAAFSYGLNHAVGTKIDGGEVDRWWRATISIARSMAGHRIQSDRA
jgi:ketosteroid isomerase-like protein